MKFSESPCGRLVKSFDFYRALGYRASNYHQWVTKTMEPRGRVNIDYFWDDEDHMPFKIPKLRLRYYLTIEFAKALVLFPNTKESKLVWHWLIKNDTKTMPFTIVKSRKPKNIIPKNQLNIWATSSNTQGI